MKSLKIPFFLNRFFQIFIFWFSYSLGKHCRRPLNFFEKFEKIDLRSPTVFLPTLKMYLWETGVILSKIIFFSQPFFYWVLFISHNSRCDMCDGFVTLLTPSRSVWTAFSSSINYSLEWIIEFIKISQKKRGSRQSSNF